MNHIRIALTLALVTGLSACEGPVGPCDARYACQVTGVDLAVTGIRIVSGERVGTDPVTMLPIYTAAPVELEATIVNRGDAVSVANDAGTIPALRPGETFRGTFTIEVPRYAAQNWDDSSDPRLADLHTEGFSVPSGDADPSNDRKTLSWHVVKPVIAVHASLGQRTELRANEPFVVSFRVENRSLRNAPLDSMAIVLCAFDIDLGCHSERTWQYFGRIDLPRVPPGSGYENAHVVEMPMEAMMWADESLLTDVVSCIMPASIQEPYLPLPSGTGVPQCRYVAEVMLRPNFESCNPPTLVVGDTVTLAEHNCFTQDSSLQGPHGLSVVALDAEAGRSYFVTGSVPWSARDADGNQADLPGPGLNFAADGRYYLIILSGHPPYTATLTAIE